MATNYGARIQEARKLRAITQAELGRRIGKDSTYISSLERNRHSPTADTLSDIAEALSVSMDWLAGKVDAPPLERSVEDLTDDEVVELAIRRKLLALRRPGRTDDRISQAEVEFIRKNMLNAIELLELREDLRNHDREEDDEDDLNE